MPICNRPTSLRRLAARTVLRHLPDSYLTGVSEIYQGEVLGEALFSRMAILEQDDDRRRKLFMLLQLESEAKLRLRPFIARLGLSLVENGAWRKEGIRLATRLAAIGWQAFLIEFEVEVVKYIARYESIQRMGPPDDQVMLRYMVEHEQVLRSFCQRELNGNSETSLDQVIGFLAFPLPR